MTLSTGSYGLAFVAGILSSLSPCVLPLLPLLLSSAVAAHRLGAAALAGGLAISFTAVGLLVATVGFAIGLDDEIFRYFGAILLLGFGTLLLSQAFQDQFALAASPLISRAQAMTNRLNPVGLRGQFTLGLLLGLVWSPCVGPTLGAVATFAAARESIEQVSLVMLVFGLGAALQMVVIGVLSRAIIARWRGRLVHAGKTGKQALGLVMVALAVLIFSGADRSVEAALVTWSPDWLTDITTRF
jgi:cytochrome c biogenesis protein CcdA